MSGSLWPNIAGQSPPRGMIEMLYDAAGDINTQTKSVLDFYIDTVGVGVGGAVQDLRRNCYLRVVKKGYTHLLFQVTHPVASPFPAVLRTPEGDEYGDLKDEKELRDAIRSVLQRERTKEIVLYLLSIVPPEPTHAP